MTLVDSNPHDYKPYSFEPKETFIEKELDDSLVKFKSAEGSVTKMLEQIMRICILINSQGRSCHRVSMEKILPEMLDKAETQSGSYRGRHVNIVWVAAILGGALSIAAGGYGIMASGPTATAVSTALTGGGQFCSQGSNLYNESLNGPRGLTNHEIQHLTFLRDRFNQAAQSSEGKLGEAQRTLQQIYYALHQIATQIFTGQG